jgi:hypothetical protein
VAANRGGSRAAADGTVSCEAVQQGAAVVLACLHVQAAKQLAWTRSAAQAPDFRRGRPWHRSGAASTRRTVEQQHVACSVLQGNCFRLCAAQLQERRCQREVGNTRIHLHSLAVSADLLGELESLQASLDGTQLHTHGRGMPARFPGGLVLWLIAEKRMHLG